MHRTLVAFEIRTVAFSLEFAHSQGNIVAITDGNNAVIQRYTYDDFGRPHVFDGLRQKGDILNYEQAAEGVGYD